MATIDTEREPVTAIEILHQHSQPNQSVGPIHAHMLRSITFDHVRSRSITFDKGRWAGEHGQRVPLTIRCSSVWADSCRPLMTTSWVLSVGGGSGEASRGSAGSARASSECTPRRQRWGGRRFVAGVDRAVGHATGS